MNKSVVVLAGLALIAVAAATDSSASNQVDPPVDPVPVSIELIDPTLVDGLTEEENDAVLALIQEIIINVTS